MPSLDGGEQNLTTPLPSFITDLLCCSTPGIPTGQNPARMDPTPGRGDVFGTAPLLNEPKVSPPATGSVSEQQQPESRTTSYRTAEGTYRSYLLRNLYGPLKFVIIFGVIGALLAIPVIVIDVDNIESKAALGDLDAFLAQQTRQVLYYVFGWLLISWVGLAISFAVGTALPYIFRFIARYATSLYPTCPPSHLHRRFRYVNPAHARYWRVFRTLRTPLCIAGLVTISYIGFAAVCLPPLTLLAPDCY
jgi:hypothetical protein